MSKEEYKKKLQKKLDIEYERLGEYEIEVSITASAISKFELKQRINECREEINKLEAQINSLEDYQKISHKTESNPEEKQPSAKDETLGVLFKKTVDDY